MRYWDNLLMTVAHSQSRSKQAFSVFLLFFSKIISFYEKANYNQLQILHISLIISWQLIRRSIHNVACIFIVWITSWAFSTLLKNRVLRRNIYPIPLRCSMVSKLWYQPILHYSSQNMSINLLFLIFIT